MVLANAFFVAAEFAFVKIRPTRLQQLAKEGRRRARLLLGITTQLPAYLSASQLGITLASLTLGWLGEPAFAALLRPLLARAGVDSERTLHTLAATVSLIVITFLHTVLGELAPKALAIQRTEPIAMWAVVPFRVVLPDHLPDQLDAQGRGRRWCCASCACRRRPRRRCCTRPTSCAWSSSTSSSIRARGASSIACSTTRTGSRAT